MVRPCQYGQFCLIKLDDDEEDDDGREMIFFKGFPKFAGIEFLATCDVPCSL